MSSNKENSVKKILSEQLSELDKKVLWMGMEDRLPQRKRRRVGTWVFLGLLLLLATGAGIWYGVDGKDEEVGINEEIPLVVAGPAETAAGEQGVLAEAGLDVLKGELLQEVLTQKTGTEVGESLTVKSKQDLILSSPRKENETEKSWEKLSTDASVPSEVSGSDNLGGIREVAKANIDLNKEIKEIELLPIATEITGIRRHSRLTLSAVITPVVRREVPRYSLLTMAGINYGFPRLKGSGYEDRERGLVGASAVMLVDVRLKNRWSLRGGIGYSHLVIRYEDQRLEISEGQAEGVAEISVDAQGTSTPVRGDVTTTTTTRHDITWHRKHHSTNLMLVLNKDFQLSHRWRLGVHGGMNYNVHTQSSGYKYAVAEVARLDKIERDTDGFYHRSWGLRPMAGVEVGYRLGRLEFILNAHFVHTLYPINTLNQNYQIKHSQAGIQLGTRYILQGNKN